MTARGSHAKQCCSSACSAKFSFVSAEHVSLNSSASSTPSIELHSLCPTHWPVAGDGSDDVPGWRSGTGRRAAVCSGCAARGWLRRTAGRRCGSCVRPWIAKPRATSPAGSSLHEYTTQSPLLSNQSESLADSSRQYPTAGVEADFDPLAEATGIVVYHCLRSNLSVCSVAKATLALPNASRIGLD